MNMYISVPSRDFQFPICLQKYSQKGWLDKKISFIFAVLKMFELSYSNTST